MLVKLFLSKPFKLEMTFCIQLEHCTKQSLKRNGPFDVQSIEQSQKRSNGLLKDNDIRLLSTQWTRVKIKAQHNKFTHRYVVCSYMLLTTWCDGYPD